MGRGGPAPGRSWRASGTRSPTPRGCCGRSPCSAGRGCRRPGRRCAPRRSGRSGRPRRRSRPRGPARRETSMNAVTVSVGRASSVRPASQSHDRFVAADRRRTPPTSAIAARDLGDRQPGHRRDRVVGELGVALQQLEDLAARVDDPTSLGGWRGRVAVAGWSSGPSRRAVRARRTGRRSPAAGAAGRDRAAGRPHAAPHRSTRSSGSATCCGPGAPLRRLVEGGAAASVLLYGPPGTGKTTLARLLARRRRRGTSWRCPRCPPGSRSSAR